MARRKDIYRGKRRHRFPVVPVVTVLIVLLAIAVILFYGLQKYAVYSKDGVKLAKKERLPLAIIKIIDEHHGNTVPAYFYYKACEEAKAKGLELPDINNFRYKGHIPSSRESAVVMLADTTEAAVRSKKITTADGAEELIRALVKDKIDHDQLSNSGLSFDDIESIIRAFRQIYEGMFHERIKYPS